MTGTPVPQPASPPPATNGGLGARHVRAAVGIVVMLLGLALGCAAAYVDMKLELAGKGVQESSFKDFATTYGFPILLIMLGTLLFSKDAFTDLITAARGFFPGQKS